MNEQLAKNYYKDNDIFGEPQIYKGIEFYPIKMKESKYMDILRSIFAYPKNFGADKAVFKMSFIKFMILATSKENNIQKKIEEFLEHVTNKKVSVFIMAPKSGVKSVEDIKSIIIKFDDIEVSEWEFEDIREIILEQNGYSIEYVNQYHPDMEKTLNKLHRQNPLDLADQVFILVATRGLPMSEIGNYTVYQFRNIFDRILTKENFDLYQPLLTSGAIKLKSGDIKNYLYHAERNKDRYSDIRISVAKYAGENREIFGKDISKRQ